VALHAGVAQVEVAFIEALQTEGLWHTVEARFAAGFDVLADEDDQAPVLLAVSDNGPQMKSVSTRRFMALCLIAQHHGRPHTPTDQAWIESFFGHLKAEWPHLDAIDDPAVLRAELDAVRREYNEVRLHAAIGYVTPNDEHEGRGPKIRKARVDGMAKARRQRIAYHQQQRINNAPPDGHDAG
jgi:putative transposase